MRKNTKNVLKHCDRGYSLIFQFNELEYPVIHVLNTNLQLPIARVLSQQLYNSIHAFDVITF